MCLKSFDDIIDNIKNIFEKINIKILNAFGNEIPDNADVISSEELEQLLEEGRFSNNKKSVEISTQINKIDTIDICLSPINFENTYKYNENTDSDETQDSDDTIESNSSLEILILNEEEDKDIFQRKVSLKNKNDWLVVD